MYRLHVDDPNKLYFTSDTHLNHYNICNYCHRPFASREEMNNVLIKNWNDAVPEDGIVVHCGDFTLMHYSDKRLNQIGEGAYCDEIVKDYLKLMSKLNGKILLLRGNHDIIPLVTTPVGNLIASVDKAMIEVDGVKIYAEHYPCFAFNGDFQVFGHIHTLSDGSCYGIDGDVVKKLKPNQYDVGVDQNEYTPISYWKLCDIFRNKRKSL